MMPDLRYDRAHARGRMARAAAAVLTVLLFSAGQASAQDTITVGQPVDRAITAGATHEHTGALDAGGSSFGDIAATYAGFRHSEIFGDVLCQSGSFRWAPRDVT